MPHLDEERFYTISLGPSQSPSLRTNWYNPITNTAWVRAGFVNYKKGALNSQPQVIKFTRCLPMVGGSLRVRIRYFKRLYCPRYCHNVSLKRGHVFSQRRTCYEIHAGLVKCLWKHCFVQRVTPIYPEWTAQIAMSGYLLKRIRWI
jgi:hypothetical protein